MEVINLGFDTIDQFSSRDKEYQLRSSTFSSFFNLSAELSSFSAMIEERKKHSIDRALLTEHLSKQYQGTDYEAIHSNIDLLKKDNCFTVCTAHQPSLITGPLYYILKSLSTIKLSQELKQKYKDNHFVPVFVHGSEDHDFEEINHLYLYGKKVEWQHAASGSTGRMTHDGMEEVLSEVETILGNSEHTTTLLAMARSILRTTNTYGEFVIQLNDFLFSKYGLIQMNMDAHSLKAAFTDIIKKELTDQFSFDLVNNQIEKIQALNYKPQATPREINLFYLTEGGRNRIVKTANGYQVLDTNLSFSHEELMTDVDKHPENYSPNVVLRPLYQERILPNLAYVGGGGELAYWLERKTQFAAADISFPILIRRNSAAIIPRKQINKWNQLGLDINLLTKDIHSLEKILVTPDDNEKTAIDISQYKEQLKEIYKRLSQEIKEVDNTLEKSTLSELQKMEKGMDTLHVKITRSLKQKNEVTINRLRKVHQLLFPGNSLQERKTNFLEFYNSEGPDLFDKMLPHLNPLEKDFKLIVLD